MCGGVKHEGGLWEATARDATRNQEELFDVCGMESWFIKKSAFLLAPLCQKWPEQRFHPLLVLPGRPARPSIWKEQNMKITTENFKLSSPI